MKRKGDQQQVASHTTEEGSEPSVTPSLLQAAEEPRSKRRSTSSVQATAVVETNGDDLVVVDAASLSTLVPDLLLNIAQYLTAKDLLQYQCISKEFSQLNTKSLWKDLCRKRWEPWPRYRIEEEEKDESDVSTEEDSKTSDRGCSWQSRYLSVEKDATRMDLRSEDLQDLKWYLSFVLSGIRGEGRSDHMHASFHTSITDENSGLLSVPGFSAMDYKIVCESPRRDGSHIRKNLRGDQPFSTTQYMTIGDLPALYITRKAKDAEWLIVNQRVMIVSSHK